LQAKADGVRHKEEKHEQFKKDREEFRLADEEAARKELENKHEQRIAAKLRADELQNKRVAEIKQKESEAAERNIIVEREKLAETLAKQLEEDKVRFDRKEHVERMSKMKQFRRNQVELQQTLIKSAYYPFAYLSYPSYPMISLGWLGPKGLLYSCAPPPPLPLS
jgi:hypothetical protein